jgi:hypothetical protein
MTTGPEDLSLGPYDAERAMLALIIEFVEPVVPRDDPSTRNTSPERTAAVMTKDADYAERFGGFLLTRGRTPEIREQLRILGDYLQKNNSESEVEET